MNYYVTHCDKNYIHVVEKLFYSLEKNSQYKILFYTINFIYENKFENVIPIACYTDFKKVNSSVGNTTVLNTDETVRVNMLFLKSIICNKALEYGDHNYCYVDADCLLLKNSDEVFDETSRIKNYPLLGSNCHEFMMYNGKGNPFNSDGSFDLSLCLEANLLKTLNIPLEKRTSLYRPTHVVLFNKKCKEILNQWQRISYSDKILIDWIHYAPFHEETVLNCLLWKYDYHDNLSQISVNIPSVENDKYCGTSIIHDFINAIKNPKDQSYHFGTFCKIPDSKNIHLLKFLHGKTNDEQFNIIKDKMFMFQNTKISSQKDQILLIINSQSLGDTIASTPTLRKLSKSYEQKITVASYYPEFFNKNPYVFQSLNIDKVDSYKNNYKQIHRTFLGVGGHKNEFGVEKKHNVIDIRQFHAIDLGFMLDESEMEYDYVADDYIDIKDLPNKYVCIHASNTWPSRTYSDDNFQVLINLLNNNNIPVVLIGKNSSENGFYFIDKKTKNLNISLGLDLTNKLSLSQCWHIINKSDFFVTMDSGLLHLAGTTDTNIVQLGSSINNKLRAPYRKNSQDYKYKYISGPCKLFCASDIKYGVKEWGTIQGVPPLINCLENKKSFECHPRPEDIFDHVKSNFKNLFSPEIEVFNIEKNDNIVLHYRSIGGDLGLCKIKIFDVQTKTVLYSENVDICQGIDFWSTPGNPSKIITNDIKVLFYKNNKVIFDKTYEIHNPDRKLPVSHLCFDYDLSAAHLYEIYLCKCYERENIKIDDGDIVVDIGSNVSTFIHYALENKASKVYSCEPSSYCLNLINKYFENDPRVVINNVAISQENGFAFLDVISEGHGGNKLASVEVNDYFSYIACKKEKVKTETFKTFINKNKITKIDFLKIDCEGGEKFIFVDENKQFFKKNVNKIVFEYHYEKIDDIVLYLESLNYEVYVNKLTDILWMVHAKNKNFNKKPVTLFLAPHLSTGGSPAYLKWLIEETIKKDIQPFVIEYCNYGSYDVQKKQIVDLVGKDNFYSFGNHWDAEAQYINKTPELIKLIEGINPDVIHLNEISESFSLKAITPLLFGYLYSVGRTFKLIETCHTSEFNFKNKKYLPDRFDFCSAYHLELSKHLNVEKNIVEMTIPNKIRPERSETLKKLNLDPDYFHVLNVGLFTENKNQRYLFNLAEKLQDKKIKFHFIGNTCWLDNCGITEYQKQMPNCVIWNERDDVDLFMSCMDLFVFPSLKELNPISIKEALSWNMPCFINNLHTYCGKFDDNLLVTYIDGQNLFNYLKSI
jgi:FkbM family methyltransferase